MNAPTVILIGKRNQAIRAAEELGLNVIVIHDKVMKNNSAKSTLNFELCSYQWSKKHWRQFAQQLRLKYPRVDAIIALIERSVVPAALFNHVFGLKHISIQLAERCTHKGKMKTWMKLAQVPCAEFIMSSQQKSPDQLIKKLGLPLFFKRCTGSGGRDTLQITHVDELPTQLKRGWMVESKVEGIEFSVESLVQDGVVLFTNQTRYLKPRWENLVPADFLPEITRDIELFNQKIIKILKIKTGITHLEVFQTRDGLYFGEIALRPPGGHIMELISLAYGFNIWQALLKVFLGHQLELPAKAQKFSAMKVFHPGEGQIQSISGVEFARQSSGVHILKLNTQPGDLVSFREGVGQEIGYTIVSGQTSSDTIQNLNQVVQKIKIELV